jgi:hypothetical protein
MKSSAIVYQARTNATPEAERATLANIYRFIIDCRASRNAAGVSSTTGDDAKEGLRMTKAVMKNTEEVGDVERSNRPLAMEATHRPRKGKHKRND